MNTVELRTQIDDLFVPEHCTVLENSSRDIFLVKKTFRRYFPLQLPKAVAGIALEGYELQYGAPSYNFYRGQNTESRFGREKITRDFISFIMTDRSWSGGPGEAGVYAYSADMLAPEVPYDEKFSRIMQVCLEAAGV